MKKIALMALCLLTTSMAAFSMEDPKEAMQASKSLLTRESVLKKEEDVIFHYYASPEVGVTKQYYGIPRVPLVHPYTGISLIEPIMVIQGAIPQTLLSDGETTKKMNAVGVTQNDPFLVVVQGYSRAYKNVVIGDKPVEEEDKTVPHLLRPMYYFGQNTAAEYQSYFCETIHLKADVLSLTFPQLSIKPDNPQTPLNFGITIHNSVSAKSPYSATTATGLTISSGSNMGIQGLPQPPYNQTHMFYGFYKGVSRSVTGVPKVTEGVVPETQGVAVLHVLLSDAEKETLEKKMKRLPRQTTVGAVVDLLKGMPKSEGNFASLTTETLESMMAPQYYSDLKQ